MRRTVRGSPGCAPPELMRRLRAMQSLAGLASLSTFILKF